ncbi:MAG: Occludin/ELL family protein [Cyanobium sp.]
MLQTLAIAAGAGASALVAVLPAAAGPVLCTTSLEAPIVGTREASGAISVPQSPVEVTRCGIVQTPPELLERRAYSWTSPYARGVDLTHQVTDLFGIAMGGGDGTKVMGFGFGDQTLIWDGTAIENTTRVLLDDQSNPMPLRTSDLIGIYNSSLGAAALAPVPEPSVDSGAYRSVSSNRPVRAMW